MRIIRAVLPALALAAALVSTGCGGGGGPATGPLRGLSDGAAECQVTHVGQIVTFGEETYTNRGQTTLVLDGTSLLHSRYLRVVGSAAMPGQRLIGEVFGWPPRYRDMPPGWKHRHAVHGFRLAPGRSFGIVIGVVATATPLARAQGTVIRYHDSGGRYVADDHFAMFIAASNRQCDRAMF